MRWTGVTACPERKGRYQSRKPRRLRGPRRLGVAKTLNWRERLKESFQVETPTEWLPAQLQSYFEHQSRCSGITTVECADIVATSTSEIAGTSSWSYAEEGFSCSGTTIVVGTKTSS